MLLVDVVDNVEHRFVDGLACSRKNLRLRAQGLLLVPPQHQARQFQAPFVQRDRQSTGRRFVAIASSSTGSRNKTAAISAVFVRVVAHPCDQLCSGLTGLIVGR